MQYYTVCNIPLAPDLFFCYICFRRGSSLNNECAVEGLGWKMGMAGQTRNPLPQGFLLCPPNGRKTLFAQSQLCYTNCCCRRSSQVFCLSQLMVIC